MVGMRKIKPPSPSKKSPVKRAVMPKKHATDVIADAEERKERIHQKVAASLCWTGGCGPSPKTSYTDMLFMLLSVLHIPKKAETHMQGFKMKKTTFDNNLAKASQSSSALSNMVCLTISLFCFLSWHFSR